MPQCQMMIRYQGELEPCGRAAVDRVKVGSADGERRTLDLCRQHIQVCERDGTLL